VPKFRQSDKGAMVPTLEHLLLTLLQGCALVPNRNSKRAVYGLSNRDCSQRERVAVLALVIILIARLWWLMLLRV